MKIRRTPAFAALPPTLRCFGATRRRGRQNLLAAALLGVVAFTSVNTHAQDPLASWNDGPAKQAIVEFVKGTTTQGSPQLVPPEERVATFDQDGTLWVEHPIYTQVMYCLEKVPALVKAKPELAKVAPFNTVLELLHGDRAAMEKLTLSDIEKIGIVTMTGISVETFQAEAKQWLAEAKHPRWRKRYTELTYLPMQEVLKYLRANGYKTYIVTGGGQDFVRVYAEQTYGVPPEQVVGTALGTKYDYAKDGKPFLTKEPKLVLNDNDAGKPEGIHLIIPRRATARGFRCSYCTTMQSESMRTVPLMGCPTQKSARSRRRSMTRRRRTAGQSSA
ncbi:unnamed protein product [uncultured bacterium]|nr:unnamed protein product [uncultured bacterium]